MKQWYSSRQKHLSWHMNFILIEKGQRSIQMMRAGNQATDSSRHPTVSTLYLTHYLLTAPIYLQRHCGE